MFGRSLSLLTAGKGDVAMLRKDPDPPQALALSADGNRLFTVEQSVVLYAAAKVKDAKLKAARAKVRELFG